MRLTLVLASVVLNLTRADFSFAWPRVAFRVHAVWHDQLLRTFGLAEEIDLTIVEATIDSDAISLFSKNLAFEGLEVLRLTQLVLEMFVDCVRHQTNDISHFWEVNG